MHQLGLTAADTALLVHQHTSNWAERLTTFERAGQNGGLSTDQAKQFAFVQYLNEFTSTLLEANNRKIAADLIRLGVLTGTISRDGEPAF